MRITYINHACLFIEAAGRKLVTDPWFHGPAYHNQWHPFPKPVNPTLVDQADTILISHAHEDHLHEPTLRQLGKAKRVFYPFTWYRDTIEWILSMGFDEVVEAASCRSYDLGGGLKITYVANSLDSIIVFEDGPEVVVNVNDALHSSEPFMIDAFTDYLRARWPRINAVFCGFGGASYFPNTVHGPGKDDREVAKLREQLFAQNFCRIVKRLAPRIAIPFAADFALLAPEQRWINDTRFPRESLPEYFRRQGGGSEIGVMYSGDSLLKHGIEQRSPLRKTIAKSGLRSLLSEQYPAEISALAVNPSIPGSSLDRLRENLASNIDEQATFYESSKLKDLSFSIHLRDAIGDPWLNVMRTEGRTHVSCASQPLPHAVARIDTTAEVLARCLESEWGGDAMIIGYACDIQIDRSEDLLNGRGRLCAELCVRHPRPMAYAIRHIPGVARFLFQTPFALSARVRQKLRSLRGHGSTSVINGRHWLSGDLAEIRRICNLSDFPEQIVLPDSTQRVWRRVRTSEASGLNAPMMPDSIPRSGSRQSRDGRPR